MTTETLVNQFDEEMLSIYRRALTEAHYNATRFLGMLQEHRGLQTARLLIHATTVSEGYAALWERKRLDLTVETVIIDHPKWHPYVYRRGVGDMPQALDGLWVSASTNLTGHTVLVSASRR
jgi:hypothetical protein